MNYSFKGLIRRGYIIEHILDYKKEDAILISVKSPVKSKCYTMWFKRSLFIKKYPIFATQFYII